MSGSFGDHKTAGGGGLSATSANHTNSNTPPGPRHPTPATSAAGGATSKENVPPRSGAGKAEVDGDTSLEPKERSASHNPHNQILSDLLFKRVPDQLGSTILDLLAEKGADPNVLTTGGKSFLHCASDGDLESVAMLVDHGADVNLQDEGGDTPCHLAAQGGKKILLQYLLEKGANPNVPNKSGLTPVMQLPSTNYYSDLLNLLVTHGADLLVKDGRGDNVARRVLVYHDPGTTRMKNLASVLVHMQDAKELDLSHANIINLDDLPLSKWCPNLEYLNLGHNELVDLKGIKGFKHLESLNMARNNITAFTGLEDLPQLKKLCIMGNKIGSLKDYTFLPRLETLFLGDNPICRVPNYRMMVIAVHGQYLRDLDTIPVTPDELAAAPTRYGPMLARLLIDGFIMEKEATPAEEEAAAVAFMHKQVQLPLHSFHATLRSVAVGGLAQEGVPLNISACLQALGDNTAVNALYVKPFSFAFNAKSSAESVQLVGSMNNWSHPINLKRAAVSLIPHTTCNWRTNIYLTPGEYEYRFLIDGEARSSAELPSRLSKAGKGMCNILKVPITMSQALDSGILWYRCKPNSKATHMLSTQRGLSYTPTLADVGHLVYAVPGCIFRGPSFTTTFGHPLCSQIVKPAHPTISNLRCGGARYRVEEGTPLVPQYKYFGGHEGETEIRWYRGGGEEIVMSPAEIRQGYTPSRSDVGKNICVAVTPIRDDGVKGRAALKYMHVATFATAFDADPSSEMEGADVKCALCSSPYVEPILLSCNQDRTQHHFCHTCVLDLVYDCQSCMTSIYSPPEPGTITHVVCSEGDECLNTTRGGGRESLKCPLCRAHITSLEGACTEFRDAANRVMGACGGHVTLSCEVKTSGSGPCGGSSGEVKPCEWEGTAEEHRHHCLQVDHVPDPNAVASVGAVPPTAGGGTEGVFTLPTQRVTFAMITQRVTFALQGLQGLHYDVHDFIPDSRMAEEDEQPSEEDERP